MKPTGIKLTGEDLAEIKAAVDRAHNAPVMGWGGGPTMHDYAVRDCNELANRLAVKNGLPDGSFWYTVSNDGEFLVPDGFEAEFDRLHG